jgi:hypothetical protein
VIRKEALLHDVQEQGIELQDQDFIWSLLYGLAPDQRLRLFLEPYYTFKIVVPDTYEAFKAELNRWTLAQERLDPRFAGIKTSRTESPSFTVMSAVPQKARCKYCHKTGHKLEDCWKRKAAEQDRANSNGSEQRFKPRADRESLRKEQSDYGGVNHLSIFDEIIY